MKSPWSNSKYIFKWWVFPLAMLVLGGGPTNSPIKLLDFEARYLRTHVKKPDNLTPGMSNYNYIINVNMLLPRTQMTLVLIGGNGPCFEGLTFKNRAQLGSRYIPTTTTTPVFTCHHPNRCHCATLASVVFLPEPTDRFQPTHIIKTRKKRKRLW